MRRATRFMLLAGCSLILCLEGPRTLESLLVGWSGPYVRPPIEPRAEPLRRVPPTRLERRELARR